MRWFKFLDLVCFDTDSGGAPGGSDGGTSNPAAAPSDAGGGSTPNAFDQLVQLMNDPSPVPQPADGQTSKEPAGEQVQKSGSVPQPRLGDRPLTRPGEEPKPTPTPAPQPGQQPDPRDEMLRAMREELAQLRGHVQAISQPPQQPEQAQPQRRYNFTAPPQVMEALRSEDPVVSQQTFFGLMSSFGEHVHENILREVREVLAPALVRTAATQADTTAQTIRVEQDFYGTHKDLDQPYVRPIVREIAMKYMREMGPQFKYTPEFRDEVARRTREQLYRITGMAQNFRITPDQAAGRQGPAQLSPQGTRPNSGIQPNGAVRDHNSPDAILSALGL
jgi:hypothetical protein